MRKLMTVLVPVVAVTAVVTIVFGMLEGAGGVLGAIIGGVVVISFLGSTPLVLTPLVKRSVALSLPVALGFLATKSIAVLVVLALLFDVGGVAQDVDSRAFGIAAIAASLTWTLVQIVAFRNERVPTYDLSNTD